MNTAPLKSYAPAARRAFIEAVTAQAARLGITAKEIAPATVQGDVLLVNGQPFPRSAESGRMSLIRRVKNQGFESTMDAVAYTWFNRLVAVRYMELHNYLDHGYRVLSDPEGSGRPEILDKAAEVELSGLDRAKVVQLKLDGTRDEELYRMLLIAQCNALHKAMPFLFEKIGDETELLLPANLLHTDSLIRQLAESIEESAWQQIEIIGWLYQFYISEKKDQVIGKVVKSEDIPAATQLFTPNWIVKYMVQNSLGAQWLATYPASPLRTQMEYYIEPAEQTEEVKTQLAAITPASLNPEEITLIDPACGSGHILVEAYDLFKAIYVDRGYRERDAAQLILAKNLYGLDIDPRAAQMSGFALMMKGRADDRRLFERGLQLNVMAFVNSDELNIPELTHEMKLADFGLQESDLRELKKLFEHASTFGSLIQVPKSLSSKLPAISKLSETTVGTLGAETGDMFTAVALGSLAELVRRAQILDERYDIVVANPPYMGNKGMNALVKFFAAQVYPEAKSDLFACFIERSYSLAKPRGFIAQVTMQNWIFLSSFQDLREKLLGNKTILTLTQIGYNSFPSLNSKVAQAVVFSINNTTISRYIGAFVDLNDAPQSADKATVFRGTDRSAWHYVVAEGFRRIPGSPLLYRATQGLIATFNGKSLRSLTVGQGKNVTADNARFVRYLWEVSNTSIGRDKKWLIYAKGGEFRKWAGNLEHVVDWSAEAHCFYRNCKASRVIPKEFWYRPGVTWTDITSSGTGFRFLPADTTFDATGLTIFPQNESQISQVIGLLNSAYALRVLELLNPSIHLQLINVKAVPLPKKFPDVDKLVDRALQIAQNDWDVREGSWTFECLPIISGASGGLLEVAYQTWFSENQRDILEMRGIEQEVNRLFAHAYGLQDELNPEVPAEQITLTVNPAYRYGVKGTEEERRTRFRQDTMQELVSYAVGCTMGRYSLEEPGLIYAHSGNVGFDSSRYRKFPADEDGIIPVTDSAWFEDDAAARLEEFLSVAWDKAHLEENLTFLADNLSPNKNETSRDTLRRYLCDKFFKDHLQTYKNRPIYWLFTSGKQKAFQCLVYLHRYNEGTLARMRSEYVIPLQGKMAARLAHLAEDRISASAAQQKRIDKETTKLKKQHAELLEFDEKLRHYADRRISLDLDDGVKVNYGKFGSLLAEVAIVHGQKAEGP